MGLLLLFVKSFLPLLHENIQYIVVENSAVAAGIMAHNFYGQLTEKIKLVGVTGTNGKTTIATLLFKLFSALGYKCGLISTVQNQVGNKILPSTHTTPDAITLNKLIAEMAADGCYSYFYGSKLACYSISTGLQACSLPVEFSATLHTIIWIIIKHLMSI